MRHIMYCVLSYAAISTLFCYGSDETVFIWDIKDTLYTRNEWKLTTSLSLTNLYRCVGWMNPLSTCKDLLTSGGHVRTELLQTLCEETGYDPITYYDNTRLPQVMGKWLTGNYDSQKAISTSTDAIMQNSSVTQYTKALAPCIIPLMFNPTAIVTTFTPNYNIIPILEKISQKSGCRNSIFANARSEMISELQQAEHNNMLSHIGNDAIFTSHEFGKLKPRPEIIEDIAEQHDTAVENCIVIESETQHHQHLQSNEIRSILYQDPEQIRDAIGHVLQDVPSQSEHTIKHNM